MCSSDLVIGKTSQAQTGLMKQPGRTKKIYTAVVTGRIDNEEGIIDLPIGKLSPDKVKRGIVSEDHGGRASISMYKVTDRYSVTTVNGSKRSFTLVEVNITTGRTHQIRVHMSNTGHPVLGDHLYGEENPNLISRQALHASRLTFRHPVTHEKIIPSGTFSIRRTSSTMGILRDSRLWTSTPSSVFRIAPVISRRSATEFSRAATWS